MQKMGRTIIISIAILVCGAAFMSILKPLIRLPFYGRVITADMKEPVADALIEVLSNGLNSDSMQQTLTRTTSAGSFSAVARGKARIMVWKPGFQISWIQDQPSFFYLDK
jgi:uncharacterized protein (DUF697 family)